MMNIPRSLRSLASRPVFPVVAVATLALGLGVNAAIFSLTREVLLRPLPYRDADRLVRVFETSRTLGVASAPTAPVNYVEWRERVNAFEQTAVFRRVAFNVSMKTSAVQVEGFQIAPAFFPMLGVEPALGRGFTGEDAQPGRDAVVLLSNGFWRRQFAANSAVVGQSIDIDGTPCTVVGVLPSSFKIFRVLNREVDLFRPLVLDASDREQSINVYAKLKPDVSLDSRRGAAYDELRRQLTADSAGAGMGSRARAAHRLCQHRQLAPGRLRRTKEGAGHPSGPRSKPLADRSGLGGRAADPDGCGRSVRDPARNVDCRSAKRCRKLSGNQSPACVSRRRLGASVHGRADARCHAVLRLVAGSCCG